MTKRLSERQTLYRFFSLHFCISSSMGTKLSPVSVNEYSTRGGTCGYILREINPSASSSRSCFVRVDWVIPSRRLCSSLNRWILYTDIYQIISIFHFPLITDCSLLIDSHLASCSFWLCLFSDTRNHSFLFNYSTAMPYRQVY